MRRTPVLLLLGLLCAVGAAAWHAHQQPAVQPEELPDPPASPRELVLFVVLDNVRADHLSVCGYHRPTSPTLEALRAMGAALSCDATAPGTWTIPSHASFFTGVDVATHGAHYLAASPLTFGDSIGLSPLGPALPTLAEQLVARGHQTLSLSGNPLIREETGLTRGFERAQQAPTFGVLSGEAYVDALRALLREVDPERPLFLFLNIADAHQPWEAVPEGLDWVGPRPPLDISPTRDPMRAFLLGELPQGEAEALVQHLTDVYDWGVYRADQTLGAALGVLRAEGWLNQESRVVITSDHGELLGEHGLLDHGRYVWQEDVGVPVMTLGPGMPVSLPEPMSALDVFSLTRDGALPSPSPIRVASWPDASWIKHLDGELGAQTSAALRVGSQKLLTIDGEALLIDLTEDPSELNPRPLPPEHPQAAALAAWWAAVEAEGEKEHAVAPELLEALRAAGYLE